MRIPRPRQEPARQAFSSLVRGSILDWRCRFLRACIL